MEFETPIIIVGQGEVNLPALRQMAKTYPIIALDGACHYLQQHDIAASYVIGDMDSYNPPDDESLENPPVCLRMAEQDSNDFEKAVRHFEAPIMIGFGLFGKRFDHSFANLHVMAKFQNNKAIIAVTNDEIITTHKGACDLGAEKGGLIAILPLQSISFMRSDGLAYPLDGLTLACGEMVSSSNQALSSEISLVPETRSQHIAYAVCRPLSLLKPDKLTRLI
ncbi:MAG: thiamine diphosphokinase [Candidatus Puniceispirillaceae bacterium]